MVKLGLVSISFRNLSPREILSAMQDAGLEYIEWGSDVHAPPAKAAEIAALTAEYGVVCCSYGTYFRLGVTPMEELAQYLEAAKILGTNTVRLWCGNKNSEEYSQEEKQQLFTKCKQADAIAKRYGATLCMECHNNTYTNRLSAALELLSAVDSENFCMYWQPNQLRTEAENLAYARAICRYTKIIHVFNWNGKDKYPLHVAKVQWTKYLAEFDPDIPCLLEFMPDNNIATLPQEAQTLREIAK